MTPAKVVSSNDSSARNLRTVQVDLDERRRAALAEIDSAQFSWYHAKVCLVAGTEVFTDVYDIFAINIASVMLGYVYGAGHILNSQQDLGVKIATPVGTLCGQLFFGWLADIVGRKRMYGFELMIIIVATFGQALSGQAPAVGIIGALVFWRFLQGVGIGGDCPLSAVISSRSTATPSRLRGRLMSATFASQAFGNFSAALVAIMVVSAYKDAILRDSTDDLKHVDYCWRLLIRLGCVPAVIALYFRLTIPETPRFAMDVERNVRRAAEDIGEVAGGVEPLDDELIIRRVDVPKVSWADFRAHFGQWKNMKVLIGTSWSWFVLDIAFYGLGLNSSTILQAVGFGTLLTSGTRAVYDNLMNVSTGNMILAVAGIIPGYLMSFAFVHLWGRKPIQLIGFGVLAVLFTVMGFAYNKMNETASAKKAFVFLYCLANSFLNFGHNNTTFVIPGEAFPTRYRSTASGIFSASEKFGAIIAQIAFIHLKDIGGTNKFLNPILELFALFMVTGIFSTLLLPA